MPSSSSQSVDFSATGGSVTASPGPMIAVEGFDEELRDDDVLVDPLATTLFDVGLEVAGDADDLARAGQRRDEADASERPAFLAAVGDLASGVERRSPFCRIVRRSEESLPSDASARSMTWSSPLRMTTTAERAEPSEPDTTRDA